MIKKCSWCGKNTNFIKYVELKENKEEHGTLKEMCEKCAEAFEKNIECFSAKIVDKKRLNR